MITFRILKFLPILIRATDPEIKKVTVTFEDKSQSEFLILDSELECFIKANVRLHYKPGKNPHAHGQVTKIISIAVSDLKPTGPYWWSTPNLKDNYNKRGARIWNWGEAKEVWKEGNFLIPPA